MIWCNSEDHFRIVAMKKGGNVLEVFTRLSQALTNLESSLEKQGHKFAQDPKLGFLNCSPKNLGTALRASVFVKLVRLGQEPGFEELLERLRLEASARFKEQDTGRYTGIFDIANSERLGQSEVQVINTMINGVGRLIALEKKLEKGEKVNIDEIKI
jgi:creatine kinase